MIIKNAAVYCADFLPVETDIETENEKIKSIGKTDKDGIDFSGCCVLPGFIDIHIHGCNMADATDGKSNSISTACEPKTFTDMQEEKGYYRYELFIIPRVTSNDDYENYETTKITSAPANGKITITIIYYKDNIFYKKNVVSSFFFVIKV